MARACYAFRADKGHWPETLEELVPEYITQMPLDPFTDKPFGLARVPGGMKIFTNEGLDKNSAMPLEFYLGREAYEKHRVLPLLNSKTNEPDPCDRKPAEDQ